MDKRIQKGILVIFLANMINVFFSLATNFLLPKYLSVESYAAIKTFQLYISYAGLLHLGYVDGVYLKYGGKDLSHNISGDFYTNRSTMLIFQLVVTGAFFTIAIFTKDVILLLFTVSIFPLNMANYYKFLYQATGEFKLYGQVMNITTISTFLVNMVLLFVLQVDNYVIFISFYVMLYFIIWAYLDLYFRKHYRVEKGKVFKLDELFVNVRSGILLTFGNLASLLLTGMDRWFVKALMNTLAFAQYSFAVSVENFLNLAITPVTTTLYNYFCKEDSLIKHKQVFQYVLIFSTILPAAAFPVRFILEVFLTDYIDSSLVVFLLFAAQMFYIVIKAVHVNLYKVQRRQKIYFRNLIIVLIVGFVLNCICYMILKTKEAFALGTLLSSIIWYFISIKDFKDLSPTKKEMSYHFSELVLFLLCGTYFNAVCGMIVYFLGTIFLLMLLMNEPMIYIFKSFRRKILIRK